MRSAARGHAHELAPCQRPYLGRTREHIHSETDTAPACGEAAQERERETRETEKREQRRESRDERAETREQRQERERERERRPQR